MSLQQTQFELKLGQSLAFLCHLRKACDDVEDRGFFVVGRVRRVECIGPKSYLMRRPVTRSLNNGRMKDDEGSVCMNNFQSGQDGNYPNGR